MNRRGRPKKVDGKNNGFKFRMSDKDAGMLNYLSDKTGQTKADIIRKAVQMYYNMVIYKN